MKTGSKRQYQTSVGGCEMSCLPFLNNDLPVKINLFTTNIHYL